ncbi:DUF5710 domain-containing protein [Anaeromicropila populeti]|uniref:DUF5710 domain-containing protein n=1 Tax=Anaeromicropila populeti TaxID=37658 RepID=UPI001160BFA2|nr:DUF5710 domain-containing protein [Anaeromicropila populeti]
MKVPYKEKEQVKKLGAKWDSKSKLWFITNEQDSTLFSKWITEDEVIVPDKTEELIKQLEQGVQEVFTSGSFQNYLNVCSKFHQYSFLNVMLIVLQNPDAGMVKGYRAWQDDLGMKVRKGEKGIRILAPMFYTTPIEQTMERIDNAKTMFTIGNIQIIKNADSSYKLRVGSKVVEGITREKLKKFMQEDVIGKEIIRFQDVYVFDISQVEPIYIQQKEGDKKIHPKAKAFLEAILKKPKTIEADSQLVKKLYQAVWKICRIPIKEKEIKEAGLLGYYSRETDDITIKKGLNQIDKTRVLIHEMVHARLHNPNTNYKEKTRNTREIEAESVTYIVSKKYGFDLADVSFDYIAGWSKNKEVKDLQEVLHTIRKESQSIIKEIDKEIYKQQILEVTVEQENEWEIEAG